MKKGVNRILNPVSEEEMVITASDAHWLINDHVQSIQSRIKKIEKHLKDNERYQKSFKAISSISIRSQFSVIVARRIYKKIGDYILMQKNIENFNKAGKIYVPLFEKVVQTFLSIFDFVKLLFVKDLSYYNHSHHNILEQEINLNERI